MKVLNSFPYETESYEFKETLSQMDRGIEAIAAMLNKHGKADIYFGVDNSGEVLGLGEGIGEESIKKLGERIAEKIRPAIVPSIVVEEYDGKEIIHVSAKGGRKPYACSGDYRIRVGTENKKIDPELLGELFFDSQSASLEAVESIRQNLTFQSLKFLFINKGLTVNESNFCENSGLLIQGKFNMLAALLADDNDISIKVVRFSGKDKTNMVSRNEYGFKCLLLAMKEANDYVLSLNETRVELTEGLERKEQKLFDSHAFEEAWTNACLHNKWIKNVPPAIYIFDDRIEIISCGGLPYDYSKEDFYRGISRPINNGLFKIMGQLHLAEQTGHGNLVIVDKYGKEAFDITDNFITVTIPFAFVPSMKKTSAEGLSVSQAKVFQAIKDNPLASKEVLSQLCQLGTTRLGEIMKELKALGKIERMGGKKGGYWVVH